MLIEEDENNDAEACVGEAELIRVVATALAIISPQWVEKMEAQSPDHTAVTSINFSKGWNNNP